MNFHLAAFAAAKTDSTANETVTAVADPALPTTQNGGFLMPQDLQCIAGQAMNDTVTDARFSVPSLRTLGLPYIDPLLQTATMATADKYAKWRDSGPLFRKNDELIAQMSNGVSTVDTAFMGAWLRRAFMPVPPGPRTSLTVSATVVAVAKQWVLKPLTFAQIPPVGDYAVIGMHAWMTNGVFARLVFPANTTWRPGCPCYQSLTTADAFPMFRFGNLGEWGRFHSVNLPQIEVLGDTAGSQTFNAVLDVVMLSQNPP